MGFLFNDALTSIGKCEINYLTDTIVVMLFASPPDIDNDTFIADLTGELSGGGYVRKTLSGKTITTDDGNNRTIFDANDVEWTGLTGTFRYPVIAQSTGNDATSRVIAAHDIGSNQTLDSGVFPLNWPTSGVFYIQNPTA